MQKKLIALAVAGLMSGAAFAQTSVTIGGKFDAGYQFKHTASADSTAGGSNGGSTTETLGDGAASTSRITISAKETISPSIEAGVNMDLRFGTVEEGKNTTTTGGINSNDKKQAYLKTAAGKLSWGVINLGDNYFTISSKPYMVEPKDLEIVKYGIATYRYTALSSRLTEYLSPTLNIGPVAVNFHAQYAFGEQAKSGSSNTSGTNRGDAWNTGIEWKFSKLVNGGFDVLRRGSTNNDLVTTTTYAASSATANKATTTYAGQDSFSLTRAYVSVFPIGGLKVAATYINQGGYGQSNSTGANGTVKTGFQDKITNL
ncbi:MAG: Gram-negative porin, partial [Proteobacteria bacterium]|nr:Gram-negative porin [Pseudomonadota bacterium]